MMQTSFFPTQITHQEPYDEGTADLRLVGYTDDRIKYAIKRESDRPALPITEWIGHHLCRLAGIPTPEFAIVSCVDGEIAFGSRWEESAVQINGAMLPTDRLVLIQAHATDVSAIHAVDMVYANPDRHAGNLLFVVRAQLRMCLAFDFSQAGPRNGGPFGKLPLPTDSHTLTLIGFIKNDLDAFDQAAYNAALDRITAITRPQFKSILDGAPNEWFVAISKEVLLSWWDNQRVDRFTEART